MKIALTVNAIECEMEIEPGEILLDLLRRSGYKSVKKGCGSGDCGACAVLIDGRAVNSCLVFAAKADGRTILTAEGLESDGKLHPIQEAFLEGGAVQCGYCIPGMEITTLDLLTHNPSPSEEEIREGLSGNLCRCTGYVKQIEAVKQAAKMMSGGSR